MSYSKRVLVVGEAASAESDCGFDEELQRRGFEIRRSDPQTASNLWAATRADIVVLDLLAATAAGERDVFQSLAQRLQLSGLSAHRPVIAVTDAQADESLKATVDHVDDVLYSPLTAAELVARIDALHRLTTMQTELARRISTAEKFGLSLPDILPPAEVLDANVLVIGDPTHYCALETALFQRAVLVGAFTKETAHDYLSRRSFDAVVLSMGESDAIAFIEEMRRNPVFFNLPVIALSGANDERSVSALYEAGASEVTKQSGPLDMLPTRLEALVREYRFRQRLNAVYRNELRQVTCDALTGLYSRGFLMDHLDTMIADAERWSEPLTVASFGISNIGAINAQYGYASGDLVIRQVGEIVAQLIRGEDLGARWNGARMLVVLTASDAQAAASAIRRVEAVIGSTKFSVEEIDDLISVELWTGMAEFCAGDTADQLVERALDEMRF